MNDSRHEYEYTILLDPDEEGGGFTVSVAALPGIAAQGDTAQPG